MKISPLRQLLLVRKGVDEVYAIVNQTIQDSHYLIFEYSYVEAHRRRIL